MRALCNCDLLLPIEHPTSSRNFIVLVAFDVMQYKNRSIARRKLAHRPLQLHPVNGPGQCHIIRPEILLRRIFFGTLRSLFQRNHGKTLLPQMHQHDVDRKPMQPGRKCRFPPKCCNLTVELEECFLRQIFGLGRIRRHPQTKRIHPPLMLVIEHPGTLLRPPAWPARLPRPR